VSNLSEEKALSLVTTNLEELLGVRSSAESYDLVAYRGGDVLEFGSKAVAVVSPLREAVELF